MKKTYFVTGIDTNIGKSYATGFLAKKWLEQGFKVITQKMIQTGNDHYSEDILVHRKIMEMKLNEFDIKKITMPVILDYPASPCLAAKLAKKKIDLNAIFAATETLEKNFDIVLIEGAGGIMVPISEDYYVVDYIQQHKYPVILVTSGRLGSVNQTLLTIELLKQRNIEISILAFNSFDDNKDELITQDSIDLFQKKILQYYPNSVFKIIPEMNI